MKNEMIATVKSNTVRRGVTYFDVPLAGWPGEQEKFIQEVRATRSTADFDALLALNRELMVIWIETEKVRKAA